MRAAASGTLIGAGIILLGLALSHALVVGAGVIVIVTGWWLAAGAGIRRRRGGRSCG
jgi:hypothetical protein